MCFLEEYLQQCRSSLSPSGGRTFTFVFLYSIIMAARRICSIFPLITESKALEKLTNNIVASRFFARTPSKNLMDSQNLCCRGSISAKAILVLPKYLLNFGFYAIAYLSIVDLRCKSYTSVVLGYSDLDW